MPVRASSGYKPAPHGVARASKANEPDENTPVKCPTCGHPGYIHTIDQRGVLLTHPGRRWPCRVPPGTEAK